MRTRTEMEKNNTDRLCGVPITEKHYLTLIRTVYNILITSPIREQDKPTIRTLGKILWKVKKRE